MRPTKGGLGATLPPSPAPFYSDPEATPLAGPSGGFTAGFFIASESDIGSREKEQDTSSALEGTGGESGMHDSTYGVRSIDESASATGGIEIENRDEKDASSSARERNRRRSTIRPWLSNKRDASIESSGMASEASSDSSPARKQYGDALRRANISISQPMTPISFPSPRLGSEAPSSPKSFSIRSRSRVSDDEESERGSQVILSSGDEDEEAMGRITQEGQPQQFIMPSITIPTRRPFTEKGKSLGKFKILVAGSAGTTTPSKHPPRLTNLLTKIGVGKTSLIKSIVQVCEDIVHVDPLPFNSTDPRQTSRRKSRAYSSDANRTKKVTEIYASTKPYSEWFADVDEGFLSTTQKSSSESILERNLCFVDTAGYDTGSMLNAVENTLQYVESQMSRSLAIGDLSDSELLNMLSAGGGPQVDVALYLISHDLTSSDIEYIRQLNHLTPVIALIAKSDTIPTPELDAIKSHVHSELRSASITSFNLSSKSEISAPYAICSSPSEDLENMDASLLMQSDFIQPLTPSDLPTLLSHLFDPMNFNRIKHTSARRLLRWRCAPRATSAPSPFITTLVPSSSTSLSPTSSASVPLHSSPVAITNPRLAAHTQREERLANIRLASWAGSLQRSLAAERARYEAIAKSEQQSWLRARLQECRFTDGEHAEILRALPACSVSEEGGALQAERGRKTPGLCGFGAARALAEKRQAAADRADPLGILRFGESMKRGGLLVLRNVGLGAMVSIPLWLLIGRGAGHGVWYYLGPEWLNWWDGLWD